MSAVAYQDFLDCIRMGDTSPESILSSKLRSLPSVLGSSSFISFVLKLGPLPLLEAAEPRNLCADRWAVLFALNRRK